MNVQRMVCCLISLTTIAVAAAGGCAPPAPNGDEENTDGLHAADQSGLTGTWYSDSLSAPNPTLVALGLGADGRFFGRFSADCAGPPHPVRSHLRGSYQILPDGRLALATDLGDAGPLAKECRALLLEHLSGTFDVQRPAGQLVLQKSTGGATVSHQMKRVDSYCMEREDCAVVSSPRDDCEMSFECNKFENRCSSACTPPIQPGSLRVRIPSPIPADGITAVPIFIDTKDIALEKSPFVLTLSRANAGKMNHTSVRIGKTGFLAGWRTGINTTTSFLACNAALDPACVGPATLTLTLEGHSEPLAQTTFEIVPKSEDLPGTACLAGGNVFDVDYLTSVYLNTIAPVHTTSFAGAFTGSMGISNGTEVAYVDFDSKYNGSAGITIRGHGVVPGLYDISVGADVPASGITFQGHVDSSAFPTPADGRVRIVELESTDPSAKWATIARATIAWEFTNLLGTKPVRFSGCVHFDREAPPFDCGDGVLQQGEECDDGNNVSQDGCSAACRKDTAPSIPPPPSASPPSTWTCDPVYYNEGDGPYTYCDCACGAPDPDCALDVTVFGCDVGQTCDASGMCQ